MKPIVTWVLLANAGTAKIVANHGPGKGFVELDGKAWDAEKPVDYADQPGTEQSSTTHGSVGLPSGDPKDAAETLFATHLASELASFARNGEFDRLIISAGPSMLGKLRAAIPTRVKGMVTAEVDKDLTHIKIRDLPSHLQDVIAA